MVEMNGGESEGNQEWMRHSKKGDGKKEKEVR